MLSSRQQISLFMAITFFLFVTLFLLFDDPVWTGHVSADFVEKDTQVLIIQDQDYRITSVNNTPLYLTSLMVSGKVIGRGEVVIYLATGEGKRHIVWRNTKDTENVRRINAYMPVRPEIQLTAKNEVEIHPDLYPDELQAYLELLAAEINETGERDVLINYIINSEDGIIFQNACKETCILNPTRASSYTLEFEVEPGTIAYVSKIVYQALDLT